MMGVENPRRLMSLDVLRGFDMFWILYPTYPIFHALFVAAGLKGCWLDVQMTHPDWVGFTFYDTIFPLFLFISGVTFPYSYAAMSARGVSSAGMTVKVLKRVALLWLLGTTIGGSLQFEFGRNVLTSAIGRIGIAWGVAAFFRWRTRILICIGILLAYAFVPFLVRSPDAAEGAVAYARESCIYTWLDVHFFPKPQIWEGATGVFSMIATAMIGMFAGEWLRHGDDGIRARKRKTLGLVVSGISLLVFGLVMAFGLGDVSVPLIKKLWTSSFALVAGGYSLVMLAVFYWIVDVRLCRRWCFVFEVIGVNALVAYLASRTVFAWKYNMDFLFGGLMRLCPTPEWGAFVGQLGYLVVYWLLLYALYRKRIYLRV